MNGVFEVYKDLAGEHRFRLKSVNGQVFSVGESYEIEASLAKACTHVLPGFTFHTFELVI